MKSLGYLLRLIILARQTKPQLKPRTSIDSGFRVFPNHYITRYLLHKHKNKSRGFTLIELMVVIVIAGMLVTFASLSISNSSDKQLETEAKRFVSLVKFAADESIMNTREIILKIEERKYSFVEPGLDNSL
ncbi:MAG: prepilin-type N-terminal cleavage/methylation domain-containing protein, partial [Gammaproteobacteria bacterium]|nr:prepilin-type N-terminal cleavage/methylation domain-containing protein [Gammaproteobacteria bacterium]